MTATERIAMARELLAGTGYQVVSPDEWARRADVGFQDGLFAAFARIEDALGDCYEKAVRDCDLKFTPGRTTMEDGSDHITAKEPAP